MSDVADLLTGIGDLIGSIAWPGVILVIVFQFRTELRERIANLTLVRGFGMDAEFREEISDFRRETAASQGIEIAEGPRSRGKDHALEMPFHRDWRQSDVMLEALRRPNVVLGELRSELDEAVLSLASAHSIDALKTGSPRPQIRTAIDRLFEERVIDKGLKDRLLTFMDLSNSVLLGRLVSQEAFGELLEGGILLNEEVHDILSQYDLAGNNQLDAE